MSMKHSTNFALAIIFLFALIAQRHTTQVQTSARNVPGFKVPIGLQLYSLRDQFKKDVPGTLDQVRNFNIKYVELAGTYGVPPDKFRKELDARGLKAISGHF